MESFLRFLRASPESPTLMSYTPNDIRRFLVWKDSKGKTTVHAIDCARLGLKGDFDCGCPKLLASGTVEGFIIYPSMLSLLILLMSQSLV